MSFCDRCESVYRWERLRTINGDVLCAACLAALALRPEDV